MIEGQNVQLLASATHSRRVMDVPQTIIEIGTPDVGGARHEIFELDATRHRGRAAMTTDDQRAAGIADTRTLGERPAAEPAIQQPAQERIAGAEHVQHLDGKTGHVHRVLQGTRHSPLDHDAAAGAALENDGRVGLRANGTQCG